MNNARQPAAKKIRCEIFGSPIANAPPRKNKMPRIIPIPPMLEASWFFVISPPTISVQDWSPTRIERQSEIIITAMRKVASLFVPGWSRVVDHARTRSTSHVFPRHWELPDALSRGIVFRGPPNIAGVPLFVRAAAR